MGYWKCNTKDSLTKKFMNENLQRQKGPNERLVIESWAVKIWDGLLERHDKMEEEGLEEKEIKPQKGRDNGRVREGGVCNARRRCHYLGHLSSCPRTRRPKKNEAKGEESITFGKTLLEDNEKNRSIRHCRSSTRSHNNPTLPSLV